MNKKNFVIAIICFVLALLSAVMTVKSLVGGVVDIGFPVVAIVLICLGIFFINKQKKQKTSADCDSGSADKTDEKKLATPVKIGLIAIIAIVVIVGLLIIAGNINGKRCEIEECQADKLEGFAYCQDHKCNVDSCASMKTTDSDYCETHTCKSEGCYELADNGANYCDKHHCGEGGCREEKLDGEKYCVEHIDCYYDKCTNEKVSGFKYCKEHKCAISSCEEKATKGNYCSHHGCKYKDCENVAQYEKSIWACSKHVCSKGGCNYVKVEGSKYCSTHREEALDREENFAYLDKLEIDTAEKQIWKIYVKDGYLKMKANYEGRGNFTVKISDSNQDFIDLLCNEIGDYKLDKRINLPEGFYYLEIKWTYGSWSGEWYGTYGQ